MDEVERCSRRRLALLSAGTLRTCRRIEGKAPLTQNSTPLT